VEDAARLAKHCESMWKGAEKELEALKEEQQQQQQQQRLLSWKGVRLDCGVSSLCVVWGLVYLISTAHRRRPRRRRRGQRSVGAGAGAITAKVRSRIGEANRPPFDSP
jgi:hypothetical protein